MNEAAPTGASEASKSCCHASCGAKKKSAHLVWTITICEGLLLVGATIALMYYWLMLPVRFRVIGVAGLAGLALFGVYRFVRFQRQAPQANEASRAAVETKPKPFTALEPVPGDQARPTESR